MSIIPAPASVQLGVIKLSYQALDPITVTEVFPTVRELARWKITGFGAGQSTTMMIPTIFSGIIAYRMRSLAPVVNGGTMLIGERSAGIPLTALFFKDSGVFADPRGYTNADDLTLMSDTPVESERFVVIAVASLGAGNAVEFFERKLDTFIRLPPGARITREL